MRDVIRLVTFMSVLCFDYPSFRKDINVPATKIYCKYNFC